MPHAYNFSPRDFRMSIPKFVRHSPRGFTYYLHKMGQPEA